MDARLTWVRIPSPLLMTNKKTFQEVIDSSVRVLRAFQKVEKRPWGAEGAVIEMVKQIGELSKLIMVTEGYYMVGRDNLPQYQSSVEKIGDELSDIFLMVIRLADHYAINLEEVHLKEMDIAMNSPLMKVKPAKEK